MKKEYIRKDFLWFITSRKVSNFDNATICPAVCKFLVGALTIVLLVCLPYQPTFATISGSDIQAQVDSVGRRAVAGNAPIWFLRVVSFLRVSQKVDLFMASLGANVGCTGGSMLAEAMIATRGLSTARNASNRHFGGGRSSSTHTNSVRGSKSGVTGVMDGFTSGGLAGVVSRSIQNGAAGAATGSSETGTSGGIGGVGESSGEISGQVLASSVSKGGNFTNNVVSSIATGDVAASSSMTGEKVAQALQLYMGYAALGGGIEHIPSFSDVRIGGGCITGTKVSEEYPEDAVFGMHHIAQYTVPSGSYATIQTVDGTSWYRQYAADAVGKLPYMTLDGSIAHSESIIKKLPPPSQRKDRI